MTTSPSVSIVIPLYNEEECVTELLKELCIAADSLPNEVFEFIFVDDGSKDETQTKVRSFCESKSNATLISLSRNFGHQIALSCGIDHARGEIIITMDADLQDPPSMIGTLISKIREGNDVVYVTRRTRAESGLYEFSCRMFYRLLNYFSSIPIPLDAGDFAAFTRRVADVLRASRESHRFLRGLRAWSGFKQIDIPIDRPGRHSGESKYNINRLLRLALNGLFAFSTVPLQLIGLLGIATVLLSSAFGVYSLIIKFTTNQSPTGFTALILAIIFCSGVQLISLAVIGSYIGRIYEDIKRRPMYLIDKVFSGKTGE